MSSPPPDDLDDPRRQRLLLQIGMRAARSQTSDPHLIEEAAGHAVAELHRLPASRRPAPPAWASFVRKAAWRYAQRADKRERAVGVDGTDVAGGDLERLLDVLQPQGSLASRVVSVLDLRSCLADLRSLDAELLIGRYIEDMPSKVLAVRYGITARAVDHRVSAAKEKLRQCLAVVTSRRECE